MSTHLADRYNQAWLFAARAHRNLQALAEGPAQYALVKLCDRITNLQPPPQTWNQDKIANYHQESQLILARLGHAHAATARRLREKIEHYRQYY